MKTQKKVKNKILKNLKLLKYQSAFRINLSIRNKKTDTNLKIIIEILKMARKHLNLIKYFQTK